MRNRIELHIHHEEPSIGVRIKEALIEWLFGLVIYLAFCVAFIGLLVWTLRSLLGV